MLIDATLSWKGTKKSWDPKKQMNFGWLVDTQNIEYRSEKAKFTSYPKGSKPSWDLLGGKEPDSSNLWRWNFVSHQELCILGGQQNCVITSNKSKHNPDIWKLDMGSEGDKNVRLRARRNFNPDNKDKSLLWTTSDVPKKWQLFFSQTMTDK